MPSSSNNQSTSSSGGSGGGGSPSASQFAKDGGYSSVKNFYESYGLNMHDKDDLEEGKAIMDAMNKADQSSKGK